MPKLMLTLIQVAALLLVAAGVASWSIPAAMIVVGVVVIVACEIEDRG